MAEPNMDRPSNKRPAETEQTIDTFAVCSNCSTLSYNLKECDKCGNPLSEDNAAMCVSAEPKRTRLESPANTNGESGMVNGSSTSHSAAEEDNEQDGGSPVAPVPVPQALYINKNNMSGSNSSTELNDIPLQPQALFFNVNNTSGTSSSTSSPSVVSTAVANHGSTSVMDGLASSTQPSFSLAPTSSIIPNTGSVQPLSSGQVGLTSATGASSLLGSQPLGNIAASANRQSLQAHGPPPLVSTPSNPSPTLSSSSSFNTFNLPPPPPYNTPPPGGPPPANSDPEDSEFIINNNESVAMPAIEIRIGTRKFLPASTVTFKEDGVLFALKDFTHAPVLLNARAIMKCQANLDQHLAFFVFLEATCIRQIRNIFNLTAEEFQEGSPVPVKRCITIFPKISNGMLKEFRNRAGKTIRKIFTQMNARYPRSSTYLQEISNMETIDLLFDCMKPAQPRTSDVIPHGMPPSRTPVVNSAPPAPQVPSSVINQHNMNMQNNAAVRYGLIGRGNHITAPPSRLSHPPSQASSMYPGADPSHPPRMPVVSSMIRLQIPPLRDSMGISSQARMVMPPQQRVSLRSGAPAGALSQVRMAGPRPTAVRMATTAAPTSQLVGQTKPKEITTGTTAPLLIVPQDQAKWMEMQKDLVQGGVYHVELPSKDRKYFLWDGSKLVPCLVQNTEVQLQCIYCRIGSLRCEAKDVKVRADNNAGIHFTIKSDHTGTHSISITMDMLQHSQMFFDRKLTVMFINLNYKGWINVQQTLNLQGEQDPCYNPNTHGDPRIAGSKKYFVMVFRNVNIDQKEALLSTRNKTTGKPMPAFIEVNTATTCTILKEIVQSVCYKTQRTPAIQNYNNLDQVLKEFLSLQRSGLPKDDDDDDVIMMSEEVGIKCPYTQSVMKEPVKNKLCQHHYEKDAIKDFIVRKKGNAKCPYAGCGNSKPLSMLDLEPNYELQSYISKNQTKQ